MHRLRGGLTYANVMATIAVFLALGGVTWAAATLPKNSVGTAQQKKNAVTSAKVKDRSLGAADIKAGVVPAPTEAYTKVRDALPLIALGATFDPVITTPTLPAGSYTLSARATIVGGVSASLIVCTLSADTAQAITIAGGTNYSLAMTSTIVLAAPTTVSMYCSKGGSGVPQVAHATIVATKVGRIVSG